MAGPEVILVTTTRALTIIAAMGRNREIGLEGRMPWHLPAELQHFKSVTMGKPIVMGRKTWEAIGRPLPGRQNIIVTRSIDYPAKGAQCVNSLEGALEIAEGAEVMLIGGGELYCLALPMASRMILTIIDCSPAADTWFPEWQSEDWQLMDSKCFAAEESNPLAYEIRVLERIRTAGP